MRINLKVERVKRNLSQKEVAELVGCNRVTYSMVERGERSGTHEFWKAIQNIFNVPDSKMYDLMKIDEGMKESEEQKKGYCQIDRKREST